MDQQQTTSPDEGPDLFPEDRDWFLAQVVNWANSFGLELPITLMTGGTVITGTIMNGADYFRETASVMTSDAEQGEVVNALRDYLLSFTQLYPKPSEGDAPQPLPAFIHLRNAKCLLNGQFVPTGQGLLWRGRLAAVDGFSLGELRAGRAG